MAKFVMDSTFMFLETAFGVVSSLIDGIASKPLDALMIGDLVDLVEKKVQGMGIFEQLLFFYQVYPWTLAMTIFEFIIFFVVYGRMIELLILTAVAPIPIATMVSDGAGDIAKRFFKIYIAVCFQGVIIIMACLLYGSMAGGLLGKPTDAMDMMTKIVLAGIVLSGILLKSGSWSKQLAGVKKRWTLGSPLKSYERSRKFDRNKDTKGNKGV